MDYASMVEDALRDVVRGALTYVSENGLPGDNYFYITFRTDFPGVDMADYLRQRHPQEMTIVLQHQFWGLEVEADAFAVLLSFNKVHERLHIPFAALTGFSDPNAQFGLQFQVKGDEDDEDGVGAAGTQAEGNQGENIDLQGNDLTEGPASPTVIPTLPAKTKPAPTKPSMPAVAGETKDARTDDATGTKDGEDGPEDGASDQGAAEDNVVTLEAFRKKQGRTD